MQLSGTFKTNVNLLEEYLRVKREVYGNNPPPPKLAVGIQSTYKTNETLDLSQWFMHIFEVNRIIENKNRLEVLNK